MAEPILIVSDLNAFYGDFQALFGLSLEMGEGEILAVIGANGAGKSTLLRTIAGLLPARREAIRFRGEPVGGLGADAMVRRGVALVPEGRRLFPSLSVEENLVIGGQLRRPGPWTLARVYELFPVLRDHRRQPAPTLSGGQQQMAAIARALMSNPELILFDEISLGLAPVVIRDLYATLPQVVGGGTSAIIVEQDISRALSVADRVICIQEGRIALQGRPAELTRAAIAAAYFGI